jgi:proteasome lid subunit RPN8/RPN11
LKLIVLLPTDQLLFIIAHAKQTYPEECCGFLIGTSLDRRIVRRVLAAQDAAKPSRLRRYSIAPLQLVRASEEARRTDSQLFGVYHSHPDAPVAPSRVDLEYAWPNFTYLVLSLQAGEAYDIGVWSLNRVGTQFEPDELEIVQGTLTES